VNPERPFPITESAMAEADGGQTEFLLDNRHLYLRNSRMTTMLKMRSTVSRMITLDSMRDVRRSSNVSSPTSLRLTTHCTTPVESRITRNQILFEPRDLCIQPFSSTSDPS
jgi:hypothetical protein